MDLNIKFLDELRTAVGPHSPPHSTLRRVRVEPCRGILLGDGADVGLVFVKWMHFFKM